MMKNLILVIEIYVIFKIFFSKINFEIYNYDSDSDSDEFEFSLNEVDLEVFLKLF